MRSARARAQRASPSARCTSSSGAPTGMTCAPPPAISPCSDRAGCWSCACPRPRPGVAGNNALLQLCCRGSDPDTLLLIVAPRLDRDAQAAQWFGRWSRAAAGSRSGPWRPRGSWGGCGAAAGACGWSSTRRAAGPAGRAHGRQPARGPSGVGKAAAAGAGRRHNSRHRARQRGRQRPVRCLPAVGGSARRRGGARPAGARGPARPKGPSRRWCYGR